MFSTENDGIRMMIGGFANKYSLPKGELPTLSSALLDKFGNKTAYGAVIYTADYEYTVNYIGEGNFDIIEYHPIDTNINDKYNDREREEFPESPDRWSSRNGFTEGEYNSDSYNASEGEADGNYAGLDKETLQGESQQAQSDASSEEHQGRRTRLIKTGADGTMFPRVIEVPDIMPLITSLGEIYGFADSKGDLYFDEEKVSPNVQIHEYTHYKNMQFYGVLHFLRTPKIISA